VTFVTADVPAGRRTPPAYTGVSVSVAAVRSASARRAAGGGQRLRKSREQDAPLFGGPAADGQDAHAGGHRGCERGGRGGDAAAGGDQVKLGQPVAVGVGDVGPLVQAGPDAHHAIFARAGDPALAVQVGDVDELAPGRADGWRARRCAG
jgi:hypothetical protein